MLKPLDSASERETGAPAKPMSSVITLMLIAAALGLTAWAIKAWHNGGSVHLAREHGILENIQNIALVPTFLLFLDTYRKSRGALKVASACLAMLSAAAFVREIEVKDFHGPEWYNWLAHHGLQEILFIAMTVPIFFYLYYHRRYFRDVVGLALRWQAWPIYLAGAFLFASIVLDERIVHDFTMRFWEELVETYGYGFLLLAAWRHHQLLYDPIINRA
jgi:hypothetical protein